MPIRLRVKYWQDQDRGIYYRQQSIIPVRFVRAVTGAPVADAPDPDDRSFAMGVRTPTWGRSDCRGAMVGVTLGDTVRVGVLREDIEEDAPLYVTSSDNNLIRVVAPHGGGPLQQDEPGRWVFSIRGMADRRNAPVKVEVRYGGADGPVIGELEPHIFQLAVIRLTFHMVTIDGTWTTRGRGDVEQLVRDANAIWRPCGIRFTYANARILDETIVGSRYRHRPSGRWRSLPAPMGAPGAANSYAAAGTVTTDAAVYPDPNHQYDEFDTLLRINPVPRTVNVYCVNDGTGWHGLAYVSDVSMAGQVGLGLAIRDDATAKDLAHELGHHLGSNHSDQDNTGNETGNQDIWFARRLMVGQWPANAPPYRHDVGYGPGQYGALISVKKLGGVHSNADGELARSRRRARNPY